MASTIVGMTAQKYQQHHHHQQQQCPTSLTRADIRDEVVAALANFAENALRRELSQLGEKVQRAIQEAQIAVAEAKLQQPTIMEAKVKAEAGKLQSGHASMVDDTNNNNGLAVSIDKAPSLMSSRGLLPLAFRREDFMTALDEWWALRKGPEVNLDLEELPNFEKVPQRQLSPGSTFDATHSANSNDSGDTSTPPQSPFSLLPSAVTVNTNDVFASQESFASPISMPASAPTTPLLGFAPMTPGGSLGGRKDWRRSFVEKAFKANRKIEYLNGSQCRETHDVHEVMEEAIKALEEGIKPHLVEDGLGGTYFLKDCDGASIAIFKPRDEEPMAPNNPKEHAGQGKGSGLKEGVLVGDAAINEYAAYLLDQSNSPILQAGVCPTALVRVANSVFHSAKESRHSAFRVIKDKVGSFQVFAEHDCTSEDFGPSLFPDEQVQRLAALDIRLCNTDRHSGNILVRKQGSGSIELVPIDHGYALPGEISGAMFEWMSWPSARRPFSEALRQKILSIDPDAVEEALRRKVPALREESLTTLRICTALLQLGVEANLTAYDIGSMMTCPESDGQADGEGGDQSAGPCQSSLPAPSVLQTLVAEAKRRIKACDEQTTFNEVLGDLLRGKCLEVAEKRQSTTSP